LNCLGINLDHDSNDDQANISHLIATARKEYGMDLSKSNVVQNMNMNHDKISNLMKSRRTVREK